MSSASKIPWNGMPLIFAPARPRSGREARLKAAQYGREATASGSRSDPDCGTKSRKVSNKTSKSTEIIFLTGSILNAAASEPPRFKSARNKI